MKKRIKNLKKKLFRLGVIMGLTLSLTACEDNKTANDNFVDEIVVKEIVVKPVEVKPITIKETILQETILHETILEEN